MKLVSLKICPFVQRVAALLEAKQIPYEVEHIDFNNTPDWFKNISPNNQVPVLITDSGVALFESEAITEYLDEIVDPLEPDLSPEQRAIDRAWGYQAVNLYLPQCSAMRSHAKNILESRTNELGESFAKVESEISEGPYFKGKNMSKLDIDWLPVLHRAEIFERHSGHDLLKGFPKLKRLQRTLIDSGLTKTSVSEDFEKVFTELYLSENTYLGSGVDHLDDNTLVGSGCGG